MSQTKTEQSKTHYNQLAAEYDDSFDGRFTLAYNRLIAEHAELHDGDKVLDVACGNGRLLSMLSGKAAIKLYGIDISEKMIAEAGAHLKGDFRVGQAENLRDFAASFDLITVCCAFHHFERPAEFLEEAYRVLEPGGRLIIADPLPAAPVRWAMNLLFPFMQSGDVKIYSRRHLERFLAQAGFCEILVRISDKRAIVIGRKP